MNIKLIAILLVIVGWSAGVFWLGGEHARKVAAKDKLDQAITMLEDQAKSAKKLQEKLDKLPKSEKTIRETVKMYPAPCPRPKPVADGLREAIDKANAARSLPSNS